MKRFFVKLNLLCFFIFAVAGSLYAQEDVTQLRQSFAAGNLADKILAIEKASFLKEAGCLVFLDSLEFISDNAELLCDNGQMLQLAEKTLSNAVYIKKSEAIPFIETAFTSFKGDEIRIKALKALADNGEKNLSTIELLNRSTFTALKAYPSVSKEFISALVNVLYLANETSSFDVMFECAASDFLEESIKSKAKEFISNRAEDYKSKLLKIISDDIPERRLLALTIILNDEKKSDFLKAEIAEKALANTIKEEGITGSDKETIIQIQLEALQELRRVSWTRSAALVTQLFECAKTEYEEGLINEDDFSSVIFGLQELAAVNAGKMLSSYLAELNEQTENGNSCSKTVVLAVINALGLLGDKTAFDNLLYVSYIGYPEEIIEASRNALARLKW